MKGWKGSRRRFGVPVKSVVAGGARAPGTSTAAAVASTAGGKAVASTGTPRQRVKCGRLCGKVVRWRGEEGWIKPERAVDHPFKLKNNGEIFIAKKDVAAGQQLQPGARVDFLVYSVKDAGGRLGADFCRLLPKEAVAAESPLSKVRGSVGASSKLNQAGKGSKAGSKIPVRQVIMKAAPKAEASGASSSGKGKGESKAGAVSPYKAKGADSAAATAKGAVAKGAAPAKGDSKDKERHVVAKIPRLGTISKWLGKYGWIDPDKAVDHEQAARHRGIFLHMKDYEGETVPRQGMRVTFSVYADCSGLGAYGCRPTLVTSGTSGGTTSGSKVVVAKAKPAKAARPDGPTEPSLPPFWEKHWSEQHKMHYYWNSKTKDSKWTKPTK